MMPHSRISTMRSGTISPLRVGSWASLSSSFFGPLSDGPLDGAKECSYHFEHADEYLSTPGTLAHAIHMLLDAPLFTSHVDRMMDNVVSSIADPNASSSTLFISLMIVLFLRDSVNPLTALTQAKPRPPPPPSASASASASASTSRGSAPRSRTTKTKKSAHSGITVGSSKIFRRMRKRWKEVVPVLMKWVWGAAAVQVDPTQPDQVLQVDGSGNVKHLGMPAEGWEERVGTTAVAVLYEMCRVQKLDPEELGASRDPFTQAVLG